MQLNKHRIMATKHTTIRLDNEIYEKLSKLSKNQNVSINEVISNACHFYIMGPIGTCYNCHMENIPSAKYCQNCGLPLDRGLLVNYVNETLDKYQDSLNKINELQFELKTCSQRVLSLIEENKKLIEENKKLIEEMNALQMNMMRLEYKMNKPD